MSWHFRAFDQDGGGTLSRTELRAAFDRMNHSGRALTDAEFEQLMIKADPRRGDGEVSYDEFAALIHLAGEEKKR